MKKSIKKLSKINYLVIILTIATLSTAYALLKPKQVGVNQVDVYNSTPINTTLIGTLIIDAPQGLRGNYFLLDVNGNVTQLNVDKNIDNLEGKLLKVEGQLNNTGEKDAKPFINALKIEISE